MAADKKLVGREVDAVEVQAITYSINAWNCFYELADTEYPSGWGYCSF